MGLALGKTVGEIRQMPYPEFRDWQIFYALEPWGWHNEEYHAANLLAMLYNANRGKGKAKEPKHFVRNMVDALLNAVKEEEDVLENMSPDEKRAFLINHIMKDFGIK